MNDPIQHMPEGAKYLMDALSVATVLGTIAQFLPAFAALLTIVWTGLRIFEWFEARIAKSRLPKD